MRELRFHHVLALLMCLVLAGCTAKQPAMPAAGWQGRNPNTPDTFRFVILSDRTGGHLPGEFEKAIAEVNLLKPDFVICVGDLIEGVKTDRAILQSQW